jgi:putative oxidoreductase
MSKGMNIVTLGARVLLGLIYFVFGLNGFLNFIPVPPMPETVAHFMGALANTGYFFPVLKATETICGLLLLTGIFAPVALVVLAPITLQIFLFHLFMTPEPQNSVLPVVMIILHVLAMLRYKNVYRPLFRRDRELVIA